MQLLRAVDNEFGLSKLRGCPHALSGDHMICRDHFLVYSTRGKKRKVYEMCVFLHKSKVVLARPRRDKTKKGHTYLEFHEALEVRMCVVI